MRELHNQARVHTLGLPIASESDLPLPWMQQTSRGYLKETSRSTPGVTTITGYKRFNRAKGPENKALEAAVEQIDKSIPISTHHKGEYSFVSVPHETGKRITALLRSWNYSSSDVVDLLHEALAS